MGEAWVSVLRLDVPFRSNVACLRVDQRVILCLRPLKTSRWTDRKETGSSYHRLAALSRYVARFLVSGVCSWSELCPWFRHES